MLVENFSVDLSNMFDESNRGVMRLLDVLRDPDVSQIVINRHDRIFYTSTGGQRHINEPLLPTEDAYYDFLNALLRHTDSEFRDARTAKTHVIEASFQNQLHGSIHICTREITRGEPCLTVRKQPVQLITLDQMLDAKMMNTEMRLFLEQAIRGRCNILVSGGSGAGKTTLLRAMSQFIDPGQRVTTCEEIDELHLQDRLPNVTALTTYTDRSEDGKLLRQVTLDDLVREALRMRPERIWVGESRGREAYALTKAANSGHDGSCTTIHGDSGMQAVKQCVTYVMEAGIPEQTAADQVARAFHLVVQIQRVRPDERRITEIVELEPVREGHEQRRNPLWEYDYARDSWMKSTGGPTNRLLFHFAKNGVEYSN